jgi:hypothetical protein
MHRSAFGLNVMRRRSAGPLTRERKRAVAIRLSERRRRITMDKSTYQARWLLMPVFSLAIGFLALGILI